jgi:AraC-like DNA-binding protein
MRAQIFSTSNLSTLQPFDAWIGWVDGTCDVVSSHLRRDGVSAWSESWKIAGGLLSRTRTPATRVKRSIRHIRRDPLHHWVITVGRYAPMVISRAHTTSTISPGTPFILSLADEWTSARPEDERLRLFLSRDQFAQLAPGLNRACGTALNTALGALFAEYLVLLERTLPDVAADDVPQLSDAVGAMVAACFAPEKNRAGVDEPQIDVILIERVHYASRKYLRSPALGPRLLCRSLRWSRSTLYRLMESEGGVACYIQRQRLLEAYSMLSDPVVDRPIVAIAEGLCFADASGFNRAFRREFGVTPSNVRASLHAAPKPRAPAACANDAAGTTLRRLLKAQ